MARRWAPLVTCEHASPRLPRGLEAPEELMRYHHAWDPGALEVARCLAEGLGATLHAGEFSRLVVDLNRSEDHPELIRRTVDGRSVPFNRHLDAAERRRRIARYHRPYRQAVRRSVEALIEAGHVCLHLSVHSFTPVLAGRVRGNDVGVLHDPSRSRERRFARALRRSLVRELGATVWLNRPYRGTSDGLTRTLRHLLRAADYVGIELEFNHGLLERSGGATVGRGVLAAIGRLLAESFSTRLENLEPDATGGGADPEGSRRQAPGEA